MAKFLVIYVDGGVVKRAGSADKLPEDPDLHKVSKGVWELGAMADGGPVFVETTDEPYDPEDFS